MGQGKLGSWDFPGPWPAGSLPSEREPCSWPQASYSARPKFRGGAWGLPLISPLQVRGSGLRGPESSPRSGWGPDGGTGGRWGETRISPRWLRTPGCGAVGRGSLDVSPLRAGCVCQAGAAWAQNPDKGPQPRGLLVARAERRARRVRPPLVLVLTLPGTRGRKEVPGSLSLVPQSPSRGCG